jgi:hypothetical protein
VRERKRERERERVSAPVVACPRRVERTFSASVVLVGLCGIVLACIDYHRDQQDQSHVNRGSHLDNVRILPFPPSVVFQVAIHARYAALLTRLEFLEPVVAFLEFSCHHKARL